MAIKRNFSLRTLILAAIVCGAGLLGSMHALSEVNSRDVVILPSGDVIALRNQMLFGMKIEEWLEDAEGGIYVPAEGHLAFLTLGQPESGLADLNWGKHWNVVSPSPWIYH